MVCSVSDRVSVLQCGVTGAVRMTKEIKQTHTHIYIMRAWCALVHLNSSFTATETRIGRQAIQLG